MHPQIHLGSVTLYTYGLMLALGFAVGIGLMCWEFRRKGLDPAHGIWLAVIAIPGGVIGARLLFLIEEWRRFLADPLRVILSSGGLSFYGGLVVALLGMYAYV